jgi:hypothetical protein
LKQLEAGLKLLLEEDFSSFLLFAWSESLVRAEGLAPILVSFSLKSPTTNQELARRM